MRWVKWYAIDWINSTARDEMTPEERGTFVDFVCLARFPGAPPGSFKFASWEALARKLNTPLAVVLSTRDKCLTNRIRVGEDKEGLFVTILNWEKYQTPGRAFEGRDNTSLSKPPKPDNKNSDQRRGEGRGGEYPPTPHPTPPHPVGGAQGPLNFQGWLERVNTLKNKTGALGEMITVLSGQPCDYSRLGKMMKGKDPAYICKLIWDMASARPVGEWLSYLAGILNKGEIKDGHRQNIPGPHDPAWERQREEFG